VRSPEDAVRLLGLLAATLMLLFVLPTNAGAQAPTSPFSPRTGAEFVSTCGMSHTAGDDPIVLPRHPGASHLHEFFGNKGTNAFSTYESLLKQPPLDRPGSPWGRGSATTCFTNPQDRSAYWIPVVYAGGAPLVTPYILARAYYKTGGKDPKSIRAFPPGLKVVAGHPHGTIPRGERDRVVSWNCKGDPRYKTAPDPAPPKCSSATLTLRVEFPDCWNGRGVDGAEHRSHMAYALRKRGKRYRVCPHSHPVPVPALSLAVFLPADGHRHITLASGPVQTGHADFFNAWDQPLLERAVRECINAQRRCSKGAPGGVY
jgi:uncharacterized protein DUF1996